MPHRGFMPRIETNWRSATQERMGGTRFRLSTRRAMRRRGSSGAWRQAQWAHDGKRSGRMAASAVGHLVAVDGREGDPLLAVVRAFDLSWNKR